MVRKIQSWSRHFNIAALTQPWPEQLALWASVLNRLWYRRPLEAPDCTDDFWGSSSARTVFWYKNRIPLAEEVVAHQGSAFLESTRTSVWSPDLRFKNKVWWGGMCSPPQHWGGRDRRVPGTWWPAYNSWWISGWGEILSLKSRWATSKEQ